MKVLLLDGHPDKGRLSSHLLDHYRDNLAADCAIEHVAVRDLSFDPVLRHGYRQRTPWEPDVAAFAQKLDACDHMVVSFPMWWGAEPAELKGLLDRVLLPGFAFAYHTDDPWWDKLMAGRSADVIVTMDTPPLFLRFVYGDALMKRWKRQILGFCGFAPVRMVACGAVKDGGVEKDLGKWKRKIAQMAASIKTKSPHKKTGRLERFLAPAPQDAE